MSRRAPVEILIIILDRASSCPVTCSTLLHVSHTFFRCYLPKLYGVVSLDNITSLKSFAITLRQCSTISKCCQSTPSSPGIGYLLQRRAVVHTRFVALEVINCRNDGEYAVILKHKLSHPSYSVQRGYLDIALTSREIPVLDPPYLTSCGPSSNHGSGMSHARTDAYHHHSFPIHPPPSYRSAENIHLLNLQMI
ncbi:hypothetical protein M422DRAFT_31489 [Sphaerobolus stellatus SS14]|uniref:Uncharacterized protein n=1 Tax=Sphaerobolus stellatus (strain SS14) TaxID=990650 RepID=A0A0C9UGE3_SPHS4|nr:hypothetical protein M422DRAFT_31489 [Sphaerobolus stellatus SS14]